jgi:ribulose-5-phosphate 4-epimerase/fuculose-1-phosphate aldolase
MEVRTLDRAVVDELVMANRILANEGILDVFGHVSIRHPDNPGVYVISRSLSPQQVTPDDLQMFFLDGNRADEDDRDSYAERPIHGAIYQARSDVRAICHNHCPAVIPFSVTGVPLKPMLHTAGLLGPEVPVWDIRPAAGDSDMLVRSTAAGRALAETLGSARVALMRGHGSVVAGTTLREVVLTAIYMERNARLQLQAMSLGAVTYLTDGEIERTGKAMLSPLASDRAWAGWTARIPA